MPSAALLRWRNERGPRLAEVDAQCAATVALDPPPGLADENLRGYVLLLSAHFQGFCRDLYTESADALAGAVPVPMKVAILRQAATGLQLAKGNPSYENLRSDLERFGLDLSAAFTARAAVAPAPVVAAAAHAQWVTHLNHMNSARNYAAHHNATLPAGGRLALPAVRSWAASCDELVESLDVILYNHLRGMLPAPPWPP